MKAHEQDLWIATFREVTIYLRELKATQVSTSVENDAITINLTSELDPAVYSVSLTLKTYIPSDWTSAQFSQRGQINTLEIQKDEKGSYVVYDVKPGSGEVKVEKET